MLYLLYVCSAMIDRHNQQADTTLVNLALGYERVPHLLRAAILLGEPSHGFLVNLLSAL